MFAFCAVYGFFSCVRDCVKIWRWIYRPVSKLKLTDVQNNKAYQLGRHEKATEIETAMVVQGFYVRGIFDCDYEPFTIESFDDDDGDEDEDSENYEDRENS